MYETQRDFNFMTFSKNQSGKQNIQSKIGQIETDRSSVDELMFKQFQTLKQINRILDSNPTSEQAKDQKIRSLIVMFKRQLDLNKKLENENLSFKIKLEGTQNQLLMKSTQCQNYEKTIFEQKKIIIQLEANNKKLIKSLQQENQEKVQRQKLIEKMKQVHTNQKYSLQNQINYLKQKTFQHFTQKLQFPLYVQNEKNDKRQDSRSRKSSRNKSNSKNKQKKNIIKRNILALSSKQNGITAGENLLKKFQQSKHLTQRLKQIKNGNYTVNQVFRTSK